MAKKIIVVDHVDKISPKVPKKGFRAAKKAPSRVTVTLREGAKAFLDPANGQQAAWASILETMRGLGRPVYVEMDAESNAVTTLMFPIAGRVQRLEKQKSGDLALVLEGSHAMHFLRRTTPGFAEMKGLLEKAADKGTYLLVTSSPTENVIVDVRVMANPPKAAPKRKAPPKAKQAKKHPLPTVSLAEATTLFNLCAARVCDPMVAPPSPPLPEPCIPFMYPPDGCWARAHEMCRLMIAQGVTPEKIWISGSLHVHSVNIPGCNVYWGWHVAPILNVLAGAASGTYVIDPSMFDEPVPQDVWVHACGDPTPTLTFTTADDYRWGATDPTYTDTHNTMLYYQGVSHSIATGPDGPPPYPTCYKPDIYVRDNLLDEGLEPLIGGGLARSPDICHYRQELIDPQGTLGSPAAMAQDNLFENVELGQPNYIYVRLQNRGYEAGNTEVDVYWMPPSTLPTPASWNLIGTIPATNVPVGDVVVAGPLEWTSIPDKGHYCFVSVIGTPEDPKPNHLAISNIDDFRRFIREHNNVTWKNFEVDNIFAGGMVRYAFSVQGWPRKRYPSDLEVNLTKLPAGAKVELRIVKRLTAGSKLVRLKQVRETAHHVELRATRLGATAIRNMALKTSDRAKVTLEVTFPQSTPDGQYELFARQLVDGNEVGRITRRLMVGDYPYVGNRRSKEVHVANCEWVGEMSAKNKVAYRDVGEALRDGYNGCIYCLTPYDTDR